MNESPLSAFINSRSNPQAQNNLAGSPMANEGSNVIPFNQRSQAMAMGQAPMAPMQAPMGAMNQMMGQQNASAGAIPFVQSGPFRLGSGMKNAVGNMINPMPRSPSLPPMMSPTPMTPPADQSAWRQSIAQQFTPKPLQMSASAGNNAGYAEGGGVEMDQQMDSGVDGVDELDPAVQQMLMVEVEKIFTENANLPNAGEVIGRLLLQLLEKTIKANLTPEQKQMLSTAEGRAYFERQLESMTKELMAQAGQGGATQGAMAPQESPMGMGPPMASMGQ